MFALLRPALLRPALPACLPCTAPLCPACLPASAHTSARPMTMMIFNAGVRPHVSAFRPTRHKTSDCQSNHSRHVMRVRLQPSLMPPEAGNNCLQPSCRQRPAILDDSSPRHAKVHGVLAGHYTAACAMAWAPAHDTFHDLVNMLARALPT